MKKILLICFLSVLNGCTKQPDQNNKQTTAEFDEADKKISEFLDILDNPNVSKEHQMNILCNDYPKIYELEYLPALIKLSSDVSKDKLMNDLKISTDYYSEKLNITCG